MVTILLIMGFAATSEASERYSVDEQAVDELFASSEQTSDIQGFETNPFNNPAMQDADHDRSVGTAFALSWVLGYVGAHRFYLGTSVGTGIGYILTLGGCGIVATIDWVVLLIEVIEEENFDNYVDNPSFFMWSGN